jgi:GNAT superfamily N-acetyltransferase
MGLGEQQHSPVNPCAQVPLGATFGCPGLPRAEAAVFCGSEVAVEESTERISRWEWSNYAATLRVAQCAPGLEVVLQEEVILTSSLTFPVPDTTHACLLRTSPEGVIGLIARVMSYFESRGLPTTVYLSPACRPPDLGRRLTELGFTRLDQVEAWLSCEDILQLRIPGSSPRVTVQALSAGRAAAFVEVFLRANGMPAKVASAMLELLEPSIGLPGVHHYLALLGEQPVGTISLITHENVGILGSAAVVREWRSTGAIFKLVAQAATHARLLGIDTLILQTAAGTLLERLLRGGGFRRAFTRTCYTLADPAPAGT